MPLLVPGINNISGDDDKKMEWANKLLGKKLSESTNDSTVSLLYIYVLERESIHTLQDAPLYE